MRQIKRALNQSRIRFSLKYLLSLAMIFIISNTAWALSQTPLDSLLSSCEKAIHLQDLKPEKVVSNEIGYTNHYKYQDKFPSKEAFLVLNHQLTECGWKQYDALEFTVNDVDWTRYLKGRTDEETVVVHRFGRTYIDQTEKRLAVLLLMYVSKPSDIKEALSLDKPNNNTQLITIQFMPFNEEEYKKKMDEYKRLPNKNQ